jgi:hypothetical protein
MKLSDYQIKKIRDVENFLVKALNVDLNNTYHTARMLHIEKVIDVLKDHEKRALNWSLYIEFIRPVYFYIEFTNNYLNIKTMADQRDIDKDILTATVEQGKLVINALNA